MQTSSSWTLEERPAMIVSSQTTLLASAEIEDDDEPLWVSETGIPYW